MTFQAEKFKPVDWAATCAGAVRSFARAVAEAAARRRGRIETTEAFRRWMMHERALDDMGVTPHDAEVWRRSYRGPNPLSDLGFASLPFQNRNGLSKSREGGDRA